MNSKLMAGVTAAAITLGLMASTPAMARGHGGDHGPGPMIEQMDLNGDGEITLAEAQEARAAKFAEADANGDGELSGDEMAAMKDAQNAERAARRTTRMIERMDTNDNGTISLDEMPDASKLFEHLDENEDGTLSAEELEQAKERHGRRGDHGKRGDCDKSGPEGMAPPADGAQ